MKVIDKQTVQRILDTADIVEVVSDFVSLKKRGANYIGLCPFHNERTPSFSVSRAKGYCKCFSCGKGGSAVGFVMELEQMTYGEALRYLAKKYHIDIQERELTDEERESANERESMLAVNAFAAEHFERNLTETADGRDIGLSYFRHRGINDLMIKKFHLGYAIDKSDDLVNAALNKGFHDKYLIETGLCSKSERDGKLYDRFRGRVIYPIFTVSGRVVAFGGRTLRSDKQVAKYVNSPESQIYRKSYELYGLYQAKSAIAKKNKAILVEGYMDVISMHQAGVENVIASSGTSLTEGQIRLLHRFTENVTVIYDSDAAGIKASLRGIDMLLAEGMAIKVLLLPDGDDPDSFAQSHSSAEVEDYIAQNETDFIRFKTRILLKDAGNDPIQRSHVINDIVRSISLISDPVTRTIYIQECSRMLDIDERTLSLQLDKISAQNAEKRITAEKKTEATRPDKEPVIAVEGSAQVSRLKKAELTLAKFIVKYGLLPIAQNMDEEGEEEEAGVTVLSFIKAELDGDEISFTSEACEKIYLAAIEISQTQWPADLATAQANLDRHRRTAMEQGMEKIRVEANGLADIQAREQRLGESVEEEYKQSLDDFKAQYLEEIFLSSPDDDIRKTATQLAAEKYKLSKVHTKYAHVETERERLSDLVLRAVHELKYTILENQIEELNAAISAPGLDPAAASELMKEIFDLYKLKAEFSKILGERIVNPR
ncbi:MAG: DNA primase [Clostridium sp.]|nr:DNA primase [Clostridium sp.]